MTTKTSTVESTFEIGNYVKHPKGGEFSVDEMMQSVDKMLYLQDIAKIHQDKMVKDGKPVQEAKDEADKIASEYAKRNLWEIREVYTDGIKSLSTTNNN
jgi:hypothetical protein